MNFRQELANTIEEKYSRAIEALVGEGIDQKVISIMGCVIVAWDGFLRGLLPPETYRVHLQNYAKGWGFTNKQFVNLALGITEGAKDFLGNKFPPDAGAKFYSSSPKATGRVDLIPQPMTRRIALEVANDIRDMKTLGVIILTKVKGQDHSLCLMGNYGEIFRADAATRKWVTCLSNRETANLMRRGQRHGGLVIDIR